MLPLLLTMDDDDVDVDAHEADEAGPGLRKSTNTPSLILKPC